MHQSRFVGFLRPANQEKPYVLPRGRNQKMSVLNANRQYVVYVSYHYLSITEDKNNIIAKIMLYPTAFFTNNHVSLHIYKNKLPMKILYYIYQICIALPILLVLTILTAIVTIVGSLLGGAHFWGYYPGKIWSQLICLFLLIPVKIHGREKLHGKTSYIFVPNHQGSFDIFLIYGFIGRNFKWMMKKSLRKIPFVGKDVYKRQSQYSIS